jgi:hypothetical protein
MHVPGGGMTYNRIHIFMSLFIYIYINIKRFATAFRLDQYFTLISSGFYAQNRRFLRSNMEMCPPVNRMSDFYVVYRNA